MSTWSAVASSRIASASPAPAESEAERNPIAEQIGELMGDDKLVPVVAADLEQNYLDDLY